MKAIILRRRKLGKKSCNGISASSEHKFQIVRNDSPVPVDTDLVFRWGCTSNLPAGCKVVNTAEAIHLVSDKTKFRRLMMDSWGKEGAVGNLLCPYTYTDGDASLEDILGHLNTVIVRPRVHAQGRHVYFCRTVEEFTTAIKNCGPGWYASEYINKVAEYRVFFAQGRAVWVANKTPANPEAIAWNVAQGGHFDNVPWGDWPLKAVKWAREAFLLSGLDFGGVDVMVDDKGQPYILEINSAPSQTSPYRQSCVAKAFDYIANNGKKPIPIIEGIGGYRKFIHPAVCPEAQVVI